MEVKTYRAATMQEALALVRRDLGPSAAVLHTREVGTSGLLKWIPGMRRIEVTAALEVNVPSRFAPAKSESAATAPAAVTYEPSYSAPPPRPATPPAPTPHQEVQTQISQLQAL